jgi:hypothetical protein
MRAQDVEADDTWARALDLSCGHLTMPTGAESVCWAFEVAFPPGEEPEELIQLLYECAARMAI